MLWFVSLVQNQKTIQKAMQEIDSAILKSFKAYGT